MTTLYDISVKNANNETVEFSAYEGNVLLIVNTAIKCGFAPQYEDLQALYEKYEDQGFYVLDFPSNQFLQSPETSEETNAFCTREYGTTFPRFEKIDVNGAEASPIYKHLKKQQGGMFSSVIKWNFTKFLVDRNGQVIKRYAPMINPKEIEADIQALL